MPPQIKSWSLTRRALAVAAAAVGATAIVIAAIFTFALLRASFQAGEDKNRSLAYSALQLLEDELSMRADKLRNAGRLLASHQDAQDTVFRALHADDAQLAWLALISPQGKLDAYSSAHLRLHPDMVQQLYETARRQGFTAEGVLAEKDPVLHHGRPGPHGGHAIQFTYQLPDGRILAAGYDGSLVAAVRGRIMDALHLGPDSCVRVLGASIGEEADKCDGPQAEVTVSPQAGQITQSLGWQLSLGLPAASVTVPGYAFALTAVAVGLGIAFAARGIGWASRPALILADSASQRVELEALLELREVPPDLEDLARQLVSLHRVSERRMAQLEEMLGEAYRRFDEMTRNFPGVIFRRQRDELGRMRYTYVSPACEKFFGVPAEEVMRDPSGSMRNFHPEEAASMARSVAEMPEDQPLLFQYRVKGGDGRERWMQTYTQPFVTETGTTIWEGVAVDVSALKQAESRELELRRKAVAENEAKSRFLAVMSHEIRNPLNSIAGYARLIREAGGAGELAEHARVIEQSSQHLKLLVNDVLDFSKTEADRLTLETKPFPLQDMAEMLADQMKVLSSSKAVSFGMSLSPGLPRVLGDRTRLTQVLMNLLTNAIKFTTRGSVHLSIRELSREERHGTFRFSVSDTGIGIESRQLDRLFKPFEQADDTSSRRFGGWGLGLAIAQRLAGLMGSAIKVESTPGKGSLFWLDVRLPLDLRAQRRPRVAKPVEHAGSLKVLIADDNEINARLLCSMLGARGYACKAVESGQKALSEIESGGCDVLLLDIDMPEMDGYEVAERLRASQSPGTNGLRIIAITGNAFAEDVERAIAAGIDNHLAKPVDFDALFQLLRDEEDARGLSGAGRGAVA